MKIKTIDIYAKEWFDKVNGNSYFAGTVTLNYGLKDEQTFSMPFQYGYGDEYKYSAFDLLEKKGLIKRNHSSETWAYCKDNKIILRYNIQRNCKKKELMIYGNERI